MFASPIDDALMNITHVIRRDEHVSNRPYQLMIADALGFPRPTLGHLPVIVGKDGKKLSRRSIPRPS